MYRRSLTFVSLISVLTGISHFDNITKKSGIDFQLTSGSSSKAYILESMGGGVGFIDYDNDGWVDIYLVNGSTLEDERQGSNKATNRLYHNNQNGTFTDVTEKAGVPGAGYGMGVAVGDYDGDGFSDLLLTQYNGVILYHNNGNGTFTDVTRKAGLPTTGWASSAVWFDYDNDGKLDLFICRFVDFDKSKNKFCGDHQTGRYYCIPRVYDPMPSWLFHNNGDGTFTDVSRESGIARSLGKAWGVVACDVNNDGLMDLFVANDTVANFLFLNRGNGKFEEAGLQANVGYSAEGHARSGMGVDAADYDQDGWVDLFVTNVDREMYSLYHNNQDETFDDMAIPNGIGRVTRLMSGWGVKYFDFDNDGNLDLFLANGHPDDKIEVHSTEVKYYEPMLLFRGNGKRFEDVSASSGPVFSQPYASRGMAVGDFNNDGSLDVLVGINNGAPLLLKNNAGRRNHWVGIKLVAKQSNPDGIGALITCQAGDLKRSTYRSGGGSYLAAHDPRIVLGIGARPRIDCVQVKWPLPSGRIERFTDLPVDQYTNLVEGHGKKV